MKLLFLLISLFASVTGLYSQIPSRSQWEGSPTSRNNLENHHSLLQGQVLNSDGTPAVGIPVRITGASGSQMTRTNTDGEFQFAELQWGTYDLEADSGTSSVHQTVMVNASDPPVMLRFADNTSEKSRPGNNISVQQLKVPDEARKQYERAVEETARQNTDKAQSRLSQALARYSCYSDALTLKSVLDLQAGRNALAANQAQQAIHCDATNSKAYFVLGSVFNAQQQYESAVRTLNEGIRFQPDAWQPYYELGKALFALHRDGEALSQFQRAETLSHNSFAPIHTAMATVLLDMKDYQNARAQLFMFLKAAPNHPDAEKVKTLLTQIDAMLQSSSSQAKK